jgi:hypothetical protein
LISTLGRYVYFEDEPGRRSAAKLLTRMSAKDRQQYRQAAGASSGGAPVTIHHKPLPDYFAVVTRKGRGFLPGSGV